jgi:hypothetical protein
LTHAFGNSFAGKSFANTFANDFHKQQPPHPRISHNKDGEDRELIEPTATREPATTHEPTAAVREHADYTQITRPQGPQEE